VADEGKTRYEALKKQNEDLKDVIAGISQAGEKQTALDIAFQLHSSGFRNLDDIASSFRNMGFGASSSSNATPGSQNIDESAMYSYPTTRDMMSTEPVMQSSPSRGAFPNAAFAAPQLPQDYVQLRGLTSDFQQLRSQSFSAPLSDMSMADVTVTHQIVTTSESNRYWFVPSPPTTSLDVYVGGPASFARIPVYQVLISISADDDERSTLYTKFMDKKRQLLENGVPADQALGPTQVEPTHLLSNFAPQDVGVLTVSQWATNAVKKTQLMCTAEKLATILLIDPLMRVSIRLSAGNVFSEFLVANFSYCSAL